MLPQEKAPHSACGWADDERAGTWKAQQERGKSAKRIGRPSQAATEDSYGSADREVVVAAPMIAELSAPRFMN